MSERQRFEEEQVPVLARNPLVTYGSIGLVVLGPILFTLAASKVFYRGSWASTSRSSASS